MALEFAGKFIITDDSLDRHSDRVMPKGVDFSYFKNNALMFWNHHRSSDWGDGDSKQVLPIGKWDNIKFSKKENNITADAYIDTDDKLGAEVFRKIELGIINATSIGFRAKEWSDDDEMKLAGQQGYTFTKTELIEVSIVDVPSNKNALRVRTELTKSIGQGKKEDLFFIKSYGTADFNKTTNMNLKDVTAKGWELVKNALSVSSVEELNTKAEGENAFEDVAKNLVGKNNDTIIKEVGVLLAKNSKELKQGFEDTLKEKNDEIKNLNDKVEDLAKKMLNKAPEKQETLGVLNKGKVTDNVKTVNEKIAEALKKEMEKAQ